MRDLRANCTSTAPIGSGLLDQGGVMDQRSDAARPRPVAAPAAHDESASTPAAGLQVARPSWSTLLEWTTALIPSVTILTALTFWFGYQVVQTRALYFGLDPSVLGFTTSDYVLRSVSAVIAPLLYLLVGCFLLLSAHAGVRRALRRPLWAPMLWWAAWVATVAGVVLSVVGLWVVWHKGALDGFRVERPWVLAAGVVLLGYGPWVLRRLDPGGPAVRVVPAVWRKHSLLIVGFVVLVCTFWSFSAYAAKIGGAESRDLVKDGLEGLPQVIVYSAKDLHLDADGVVTEPLPDPTAAYRWKYTGLRLLVFSGGKYFMLPADWQQADDVAIVLAESPGVRVEFQRKDADS